MLQRFAQRWQRLRALDTAAQRLLLAACLLLPLFRLALGVLGLRRFNTMLCGPVPPSREQSADPAAIAHLVNLASRHSPFGATCLTRSLLLVWLLRRRGIASALRIGVRLRHGVLEAHAWVERGGVPINDTVRGTRDFAAFDQAIPARSFSAP